MLLIQNSGAVAPPVVPSFLSVFARSRFLSAGQKISLVAPGRRHNSRLIFELERTRVICLQVWCYRRIGTHSHSVGLTVLSLQNAFGMFLVSFPARQPRRRMYSKSEREGDNRL